MIALVLDLLKTRYYSLQRRTFLVLCRILLQALEEARAKWDLRLS